MKMDVVSVVAGLLHDTIEDTQATYNIIKKKFNKEVANLVKALSSNKKAIEKRNQIAEANRRESSGNSPGIEKREE